MTVGQTHQLGKIVGPSDAKVHWNVANDNIATIDQNGKITALAPGSTAVWIEVSKFEVTETATFTLTIEPFAITNIPENHTLMVNQTHKLSLSIPNSATWFSSNPDVIEFIGNGELIAKKAGKSEIKATVNRQSYKITITVIDGPQFFTTLLNKKLINNSHIKTTDDGFFLCTKSVGDILISAGINALINSDGTSESCSSYYDDYYFYAVKEGTNYAFSIMTLREQEGDQGDDDTAVVSIPFINFNNSYFLNCINEETTTRNQELKTEIYRITKQADQQHHEIFYNYFSEPASDGSYLIAEEYIKKIVKTAIDGKVTVSNNLTKANARISEINEELKDGWSLTLEDEERLKAERWYLYRVTNAVNKLSDKLGYELYYDTKLNLKSSVDHLSIYEKQAILAMLTGNVTFNSFAAEVKFHADFLKFSLGYEHAIRADMAVPFIYDQYDIQNLMEPYYDLDNPIVQEQIQYHGEY